MMRSVLSLPLLVQTPLGWFLAYKVIDPPAVRKSAPVIACRICSHCGAGEASRNASVCLKRDCPLK